MKTSSADSARAKGGLQPVPDVPFDHGASGRRKRARQLADSLRLGQTVKKYEPVQSEGRRGSKLSFTFKRRGMGLVTHEEYTGERYFRSLDGLRAISILLVLTWHVNSSLWAWLSGWEGPSIFFVISGFLITTLCLREEDRDGAVSMSAFFVRRACRILPIYFVVLAFYVLVDIGFNRQGQRGALLDALPYYVSYTNELAPGVGHLGTPFRLSWTLGIEEKFYLLWPL